MKDDRGVALILALLVLSFLTVIGGAFLMTSTIDVWISDNYKSAAQSVYLAEAGVDDAREMLRSSPSTTNELLMAAAGVDRELMTSDDQPLISSRLLVDSFGKSSGSYEVWLRNDNGDGSGSLADTNEVVKLISVAKIGSARKTIDATVRKGKFPETDSDARLKSVAGLEGLVSSIMGNATDLYSAPAMGSLGSPADYRIAIADGNLDLGPGTGYGILLVRGELAIVGDVTWNGLMLVIGQGVLRWKPGATGTINGGLFIARTRASDGSLLIAPADVAYTISDVFQIKAANRRFPFNPIAINEK